MRDNIRMWVLDILAGGLVGGLIAGIVAVNIVIYAGIEPGYEASLAEVFEQNALVGIIVIAVFVAGPTLGVIAARNYRRRRAREQHNA